MEFHLFSFAKYNSTWWITIGMLELRDSEYLPALLRIEHSWNGKWIFDLFWLRMFIQWLRRR